MALSFWGKGKNTDWHKGQDFLVPNSSAHLSIQGQPGYLTLEKAQYIFDEWVDEWKVLCVVTDKLQMINILLLFLTLPIAYIPCARKRWPEMTLPVTIERRSEVTEEEIDSIRCTIDVAIIICQEILFYITNKIPFQAFSLEGLRYVLLGGFLREKNWILNNLGSTSLK